MEEEVVEKGEESGLNLAAAARREKEVGRYLESHCEL